MRIKKKLAVLFLCNWKKWVYFCFHGSFMQRGEWWNTGKGTANWLTFARSSTQKAVSRFCWAYGIESWNALGNEFLTMKYSCTTWSFTINTCIIRIPVLYFISCGKRNVFDLCGHVCPTGLLHRAMREVEQVMKSVIDDPLGFPSMNYLQNNSFDTSLRALTAPYSQLRLHLGRTRVLPYSVVAVVNIMV